MIADLQLGAQVEMLVFRSDLYTLMQQADGFVLSSWFEGMPNVFLEALGIGESVVVSDIPGNRDIIKDTRCALPFNPDSSDQLADGLSFILGSPDLVASLIQAGNK